MNVFRVCQDTNSNTRIVTNEVVWCRGMSSASDGIDRAFESRLIMPFTSLDCGQNGAAATCSIATTRRDARAHAVENITG